MNRFRIDTRISFPQLSRNVYSEDGCLVSAIRPWMASRKFFKVEIVPWDSLDILKNLIPVGMLCVIVDPNEVSSTNRRQLPFGYSLAEIQLPELQQNLKQIITINRRRPLLQNEEPRINCLRISDVFATSPILALAQISSVLPKFCCFHRLLLQIESDCRNISKLCPRPCNNFNFKTTKNWSIWSHTRAHDDLEIMSTSHIHVTPFVFFN